MAERRAFWLVAFFIGLIVFIGHCRRSAEAHTGDHIPPAAERYRRDLTREVRFYFSMSEPVARFAGQVHQESAWRAGVCSAFACGLTQFTPGTAKDITAMHPADLGSAPRVFDPAWALRAMVLYMRGLRLAYADFDADAHAAALAAYNGGSGWLTRERAVCRRYRLMEDFDRVCDPQRWFGGVERYCLRARWACDENRAYVRAILFRWAPRYAAAGW